MTTAQAGGLTVHTEVPLNAESPLEALCRSRVTPTRLFFVRNHGPIPLVEPGTFRLTVQGAVRHQLHMGLDDLRRRFPRATVAATLVCAGNRRHELDQVAPTSGLPWGAGAIGNARWTGARLADVLERAGVLPGGTHVAFEGLDGSGPEGRGEVFGGSIPIAKALRGEVLLAYEMNGEPLPPEHGFPLRVVVPGYAGARSVKWLRAISVQREPSTSFFQREDYALGGRPLGELALTSAICRPGASEVRPRERVRLSGYAIGAGGRPLRTVEVSADGGATWRPATLSRGDPWTWRHWESTVTTGRRARELAVRAWDSSPAGQPADLAAAWNRRGYMNNAWHRVRLG
jgi:sulfite oxidase